MECDISGPGFTSCSVALSLELLKSYIETDFADPIGFFHVWWCISHIKKKSYGEIILTIIFFPCVQSGNIY